jgi:hypothetical protein
MNGYIKEWTKNMVSKRNLPVLLHQKSKLSDNEYTGEPQLPFAFVFGTTKLIFLNQF